MAKGLGGPVLSAARPLPSCPPLRRGARCRWEAGRGLATGRHLQGVGRALGYTPWPAPSTFVKTDPTRPFRPATVGLPLGGPPAGPRAAATEVVTAFRAGGPAASASGDEATRPGEVGPALTRRAKGQRAAVGCEPPALRAQTGAAAWVTAGQPGPLVLPCQRVSQSTAGPERAACSQPQGRTAVCFSCC